MIAVILAEQGTHEDLVAVDGAYRRLWERQGGFALDRARHRAEIQLERLRLVPVFYGMPDDLLAEAVTMFRTEEYPGGHTVIRQGDYGASLYIIVRGRVELSIDDGAHEPRVVATLDEGECFGQAALFESQPESETALTTVPCVFLTINRASYHSLRERSR